jgi:hypothetical protein
MDVFTNLSVLVLLNEKSAPSDKSVKTNLREEETSALVRPMT